MKKLSKKKIVLLICLLLVVGVAGALFVNSHTVFPYITEKNIVYMPKGLAVSAYHEISIDSEDCWVFKPNKKERSVLLEDVQTDSWSKMEAHHIELLARLCPNFGDGKVVNKLYGDNEIYICVYDAWHEENISNYEDVCSVRTTKWIIYAYDADENLYYCFYVTT